MTWFRKAAEQGYAPAQTNLGNMYMEGRGVPQDDAEGVRWYRMAADQGLADAQNNLGFAYDSGQGVAIADMKGALSAEETGDLPTAVRLYQEFAEKGDALAQTSITVAFSF